MKRILLTLLIILTGLVGFSQTTYMYKSEVAQVQKWSDTQGDYVTTAESNLRTYLFISTDSVHVFNPTKNIDVHIALGDVLQKSKKGDMMIIVYAATIGEDEEAMVTLRFDGDDLTLVGVADKEGTTIIWYKSLTFITKSQ